MAQTIIKIGASKPSWVLTRRSLQDPQNLGKELIEAINVIARIRLVGETHLIPVNVSPSWLA
jgi:hypothetical protein